MCSRNATLKIHAKRISTFLTTLQLMGFAPMIYWLFHQNHNIWNIFFLYIAVFIHYLLNNILYFGAQQKTGRNCYVLIWLISYAIEFIGLFVFGMYCAYSALTWPTRGWPEYYINNPTVLSIVSMSVTTFHVLCWVMVLRFYTLFTDCSRDAITIMTASGLKCDRDNNISVTHSKGDTNHFSGCNVEGDEWSSDVFMEIGRRVWNKSSEDGDSVYISDQCLQGTGSGRLFIIP